MFPRKPCVKKFSLHSVANMMAIRPSRVEIGGHRVALPGIASPEPLLRGCNQRDWLEKLTALGIRHLVLPLNNGVEDACVFARRHPVSSESEAGKSGVLYDLAHRDEGLFARLHFLFEAAEQIGVLIGLSLFNAHGARASGPFLRHANEQGVCFDDLLQDVPATESALLRSVRKKRTTVLRRRAVQRDKMQAALTSTVDWIAAAVRGRRGVWVEVCRGSSAESEAAHASFSSRALAQLEQSLTQRLMNALAKPGEDAAKAKLGPWVAASPEFNWNGGGELHAAPFGVQHDVPLGQRAFPKPGNSVDGESQRCPKLCWLASGRGDSTAARGPQRAALWRSVMRGCWPLVSFTLSEETDHRGWKDMAQIATFNRQWVGRGYLRPCPEILAPMPDDRVSEGKICAATDGAGRYFAFLTESLRGGLKLSTLPGSYRYYWFDPASGRGLDYGDGIEGGRRCAVPTPGSVRHALLILEQEELPDPFSVW